MYGTRDVSPMTSAHFTEKITTTKIPEEAVCKVIVRCPLVLKELVIDSTTCDRNHFATTVVIHQVAGLHSVAQNRKKKIMLLKTIFTKDLISPMS